MMLALAQFFASRFLGSSATRTTMIDGNECMELVLSRRYQVLLRVYNALPARGIALKTILLSLLACLCSYFVFPFARAARLSIPANAAKIVRVDWPRWLCQAAPLLNAYF
jgi:hypothetical protein